MSRLWSAGRRRASLEALAEYRGREHPSGEVREYADFGRARAEESSCRVTYVRSPFVRAKRNNRLDNNKWNVLTRLITEDVSLRARENRIRGRNAYDTTLSNRIEIPLLFRCS